MINIPLEEPLFKKAAVFTDIHFGDKSDSEVHNDDCLRYIKWFINQVKENECDTIIFLGDWFDNEIRIGVNTSWVSNQAINLLIELDLPIYWLLGNHDLLNKHSRSVHSLPGIGDLPNITLIDQITKLGDVLFCPWLVGDEFVIPPTVKAKYVFGHFGLPSFLLNAGREQDDNGGLHGDHFLDTEMVFTGHFHKRQIKLNAHEVPICYIGNAFAHDMNDVNDRARGCMILSYGEEPVFLDWKEGPNYNRAKLSHILNLIEEGTIDDHYNQWSVIDCVDDMDLDTKSNIEIKEELQTLFRSFTLTVPLKEIENDETDVPLEEQENITTMVRNHLMELDTEGSKYDTKLLVDIWDNVGEK